MANRTDSEIVAIRFIKCGNKWNPQNGLKWCLKNNLKIMKNYYEDEDCISFRLKDHHAFRKFEEYPMGDEIIFIIGY
jgi:hypothetical protein